MGASWIINWLIAFVAWLWGQDRSGILGKVGNRDYVGKTKIKRTKSGIKKCLRGKHGQYGCFYGFCIVCLCIQSVCVMWQPDKGSIRRAWNWHISEGVSRHDTGETRLQIGIQHTGMWKSILWVCERGVLHPFTIFRVLLGLSLPSKPMNSTLGYWETNQTTFSHFQCVYSGPYIYPEHCSKKLECYLPHPPLLDRSLSARCK